MPFITEPLVQELAEGLTRYDAMLPQSDGRRGVEPLCAAYGPACADAIATSLDEGDLRAIGFHRRIRVGILPLDRVRALADPDLLFFNVNTADDLARADELWRRHALSR
jgi:molybdopterin-guanine dinucleotide biosynthesis protein A